MPRSQPAAVDSQSALHRPEDLFIDLHRFLQRALRARSIALQAEQHSQIAGGLGSARIQAAGFLFPPRQLLLEQPSKHGRRRLQRECGAYRRNQEFKPKNSEADLAEHAQRTTLISVPRPETDWRGARDL